jgi:hypothetical protein
MRVAVGILFASLCFAQTEVPDWTPRLLQQVLHSSFPELCVDQIRLRPFKSRSDYFEARFDFVRMLLGTRMRYVIRVNGDPVLLTCGEDAKRAIIAHEVAHVLYYSRRSRLKLLGLVRLLHARSRSRFEREADAEAIRRGYAEGLKQYRNWLYQHVPISALPEKLRDYMSPAEIDALTAGSRLY